MRAPAPLLLLLVAAAADLAPPPPTLLLLRAACEPDLRRLFDEGHLRLHEPVRPLLASRRLRLLTFEETCGPDWRATVTRASLAALSEDGTVLSVGWPGAGACGALVAGARALGRAPAAACAAGESRGAAAAQLVWKLGWRRAQLPPAPARSECAAALRAVARELAAAAVAVRWAPLAPDELAWRPHVVILCASRRGGGSSAAASLGAPGSGPPLLLVHVEEPERPSRASPSPPRLVANDGINDAFQLSNISFVVVGESLLKQNNINNNSSTDEISPRYLSYFRRRTARSISISTVEPLMHNTNETTEIDSIPLRSKEEHPDNVVRSQRFASAQETIRVRYDAENRGYRNRRRDPSHLLHSDFQIKYLGRILSRTDIHFFQHVLLLTDGDLNKRPYLSEHDVYAKVIEAIENDSKAAHSRIEHSYMKFYLYEWSDVGEGAWRHAADLSTTSTRSLDSGAEWLHVIGWSNVTLALDRWRAAAPGRAEEASGAAALSAAAACSALALASAAALIGRWLSQRRRRRRRREDAVLAVADFTFPVDERRRVGEGMETMLSCWLQQLHEFGGPELERPDLLKQPPHATPLVPSAPSSTCSVNRAVVDRRIRYKGDVVHVKYLPGTTTLELKRKATDVLLVMQNLRHENLNPFIGCLCEARAALVFDHCLRGSLEDVLMADEIKLDWTFRLSLLTDLVKGMRYLHSSALRTHGRLSSRNCVVDSRWVLRVTDYGLPALHQAQALPQAYRTARDLLWTAPELLRESRGEGRGSQPGDVFSFAIIMQEVIVRGEPYCMLALTPDEIVEKLCRPPPLIRPSVSMGAAPPEAVSVMRQCWSEAPDLRPDFHRLHDIFRHLHRGRKINIVDSMFEMLEKYSNNLEELIRERTEQLDMEKKKTEQLLNRMLPRSVAERLLLGSRVEPEEFEEVSIYFSDIVGFTALAARSTPVQVVDLLNDLYTTFDAAIERYKVYKVETIGDAYMVVGGLPVRTRDHAESVATMALHLLHLAGQFRVRHLPDTPLQLRIGLHTGPVCAAVVGLTMPRYCLFGDTVNTASRMESTGAAWRIQVSATTAERLAAAGAYRLRSRGLTQIKGKGAMHTYWLLGKEGFDKALPTPPALESEEVLFEMEGENEGESPPPTSRSPALVRQVSDPPPSRDKQGARVSERSGAVSADNSPSRAAASAAAPAAAPAPALTAATSSAPAAAPAPAAARAAVLACASLDHTAAAAPYSRYRCLGNGRRPLRRQWSLERGDGLAAAAGGGAAGAEVPASAPSSPPEWAPLVLLGGSAPAPRGAPRYRTRPERDT